MKAICILMLAAIGFNATGQTTINNGGFELWGNPSPGIAAEPTHWYSNKSGSAIAVLGPQTCFQEATIVHSGTYSVKVVTENYLGTAVNGVVTTGVVNAPTISSKDSGYIGTTNYTTPTDQRRMSFTSRPDSLVGWYQYVSGGAGEQAKIRAILHTGDYYDPETPTNSYHPDPTANKIADVTFLGPASNVSSWTRFSVPFHYYSTSSPAYIMINVTSSANQATTIMGSTLYLDDIQVTYNIAEAVTNIGMKPENANVYANAKRVYVGFSDGNGEQSLLTIYDLTGRVVFFQSIENSQFASFYLADLNTGIYLFQLNNKDYRKTGKLFIQ